MHKLPMWGKSFRKRMFALREEKMSDTSVNKYKIEGLELLHDSVFVNIGGVHAFFKCGLSTYNNGVWGINLDCCKMRYTSEWCKMQIVINGDIIYDNTVES